MSSLKLEFHKKLGHTYSHTHTCQHTHRYSYLRIAFLKNNSNKTIWKTFFSVGTYAKYSWQLPNKKYSANIHILEAYYDNHGNYIKVILFFF